MEMDVRHALNELRKLNPPTTITNPMIIDRYLDLCKQVVEEHLDRLEKLEKENEELKKELQSANDVIKMFSKY